MSIASVRRDFELEKARADLEEVRALMPDVVEMLHRYRGMTTRNDQRAKAEKALARLDRLAYYWRTHP